MTPSVVHTPIRASKTIPIPARDATPPEPSAIKPTAELDNATAMTDNPAASVATPEAASIAWSRFGARVTSKPKIVASPPTASVRIAIDLTLISALLVSAPITPNAISIAERPCVAVLNVSGLSFMAILKAATIVPKATAAMVIVVMLLLMSFALAVA